MLNLLIIEENIEKYKTIANYILQQFKEIRICGISYNVQEAIKIMKKQKVDAILHNNYVEDAEKLKLINFIYKQNIKEENIYTILLLREEKKSNYAKDQNNYSWIYRYKEIAEVFSTIEYIIREIRETQSKNMIQKRIYSELENLQYNFSHIGTQYIKEAILEIYISKNCNHFNLNKTIYPIIAQRHNTSVNNVKCNIAKATKNILIGARKEKEEKYFNNLNMINITAKEVIYKVLSKL